MRFTFIPNLRESTATSSTASRPAGKTRRDPYFPAEIGHRCCTVTHLGNISMLLGRKLKWNPDKEIFPNDDEANRLLSRPMRSPWHL
ncbi:MAG: hypothetical protein ACYTEQ_28195 [Planctomycetota bacterium]